VETARSPRGTPAGRVPRGPPGVRTPRRPARAVAPRSDKGYRSLGVAPRRDMAVADSTQHLGADRPAHANGSDRCRLTKPWHASLHTGGRLPRRRCGSVMSFGLETMRALVDEMDHPEARLSRCSWPHERQGLGRGYCDAAAARFGAAHRPLHLPHLVRVNEPDHVDGREITTTPSAVGARRPRRRAERLVRRGSSRAPDLLRGDDRRRLRALPPPARGRGVLETGLGAGLDATNVAEPVASAIVSIDFDHEVYWAGRSPRSRRKGGRAAAGTATVIGPLPDEAREAVRARARAIGARSVEARHGVRFVRTRRWRATSRPSGWPTLRSAQPTARYARLRPLPGAHQRDNLALAIRCWRSRRAGSRRPAEDRPGPSPHALAGRLEWSPVLHSSSSTRPQPRRRRAALAGYLAVDPVRLVFGRCRKGRARSREPSSSAGGRVVLDAAPRSRVPPRGRARARRAGASPHAPTASERRPRPRPGPTSRGRGARADDDGRRGGEPLPRRRRQGDPGAGEARAGAVSAP